MNLGDVADSNIILDTILRKYNVGLNKESFSFYWLNPNNPDSTFVFLDQIYKDFKIPSKKVDSHVFCLVPLNIDNAEYNSEITEATLFNQEFNENKITNVLNVSWVPLPSRNYPKIPKWILVQNWKVEEFPRSLSLNLGKYWNHSGLESMGDHKWIETKNIYKYLRSYIKTKYALCDNQISQTAVMSPSTPAQFSSKKAEDLYKSLVARNSKIQSAINSYSEQ